jgi:hypothetical protein
MRHYVLQRFDENLFELKLPKRGRCASARDPKGDPTNPVWLKHADQGICRYPVDAPTDDQIKDSKHKTAGRKAKEFDYDEIIELIKGKHFSLRTLAERITKFSRIAVRTAWTNVIPHLNRKMIFDSEFKTYSATS